MQIKKFISSILFRFLIGSVLTGLIIVSIIFLSYDFNKYLDGIYNGQIIQFIVFGLLLLVGLLGLVVLTSNKKPKLSLIENRPNLPVITTFDVNIIVFKFVTGFISAFLKNKDNRHI